MSDTSDSKSAGATVDGTVAGTTGSRKGPVKAKLFINGRSQAVRIPKELAFIGIDAVYVERQGNAVILTPARQTWQSFAELEPADEEFMTVRPRLVKT